MNQNHDWSNWLNWTRFIQDSTSENVRNQRGYAERIFIIWEVARGFSAMWGKYVYYFMTHSIVNYDFPYVGVNAYIMLSLIVRKLG